MGETHKRSSRRRGSVRAETSDAADPGGARVCPGGRRCHRPQHPSRPSPSSPGEVQELPVCNFHEPGCGQPPCESLHASVPAAESPGCRARPCGRGAGGDGEPRAGLEARGRHACVRGPAAGPGACRITQVMGTRARPGSRCRRTAPSFAPGARSHPGTPPAPGARPPELPPLPCPPSPRVASC